MIGVLGGAARLSTGIQAMLSARTDNRAVPTKNGRTPTLAIVQHVELARTYHYRFDASLDADGRDVFATAVTTFNRTGLVRLVPGTAPFASNQITFAAYHQGDQRAHQLELGHGGPQIIQPWGGRPYNRATAQLNMTHPQAVNDAVATHELGHALGLAHSSSRDSVMYPEDYGNTDLTAADLAGLRQVYGRPEKTGIR